MSSLDPAMDAALGGASVCLFGAVEILYPTFALRLVDGAGFITFGGNTFVGADPIYGALGGVSDYTDGIDAEAPALTITLLPPSTAAMTALCDPAAQGSQVSLWVGAADKQTGLPIGTPSLRYIGQTDVPMRKVGQNTRSVEMSVVSAFDFFFGADEGACLNSGFHQSIWPGELGLEFVSTVQQQFPWGVDGPRPNLVTDVPRTTLVSGGGLGGIFGEFA